MKFFLEEWYFVFGFVEFSYFFFKEKHNFIHLVFFLFETVTHFFELFVLLDIMLQGRNFSLKLIYYVSFTFIFSRKVPIFWAEHSIFFFPTEYLNSFFLESMF